MWKLNEPRSRCFCRLLGAVLTLAAFGRGQEIRDFIATNTLSDGEVETRIFYKGVCSKEISVGQWPTNGITFRQVTDGNNLIQLIYNNGEDLKDCEIVHHKDQVKKFLETFKSDLNNLITTSNVTVESLDNKELPEDVAIWFNYTRLKSKCRKIHFEIKKELEGMKHGNQRSSRRQKRSLLIFPGTLWCGASDRASTYTQLGAMFNTDRCCRRHDHCKIGIPGYTTKYHYNNYTPFTISHCQCDSSFRACLKLVGTSDANLVGKLFFNVVQSKCFVIKPKKKCVKWSWWGKCEKFKHEKQAVLRDNLHY